MSSSKNKRILIFCITFSLFLLVITSLPKISGQANTINTTADIVYSGDNVSYTIKINVSSPSEVVCKEEFLINYGIEVLSTNINLSFSSGYTFICQRFLNEEPRILNWDYLYNLTGIYGNGSTVSGTIP